MFGLTTLVGYWMLPSIAQDLRGMTTDLCKFMQIYANLCTFMQIGNNIQNLQLSIQSGIMAGQNASIPIEKKTVAITDDCNFTTQRPKPRPGANRRRGPWPEARRCGGRDGGAPQRHPLRNFWLGIDLQRFLFFAIDFQFTFWPLALFLLQSSCNRK